MNVNHTPVIIIPQAAFSLFTEKGTLIRALYYLFPERKTKGGLTVAYGPILLEEKP